MVSFAEACLFSALEGGGGKVTLYNQTCKPAKKFPFDLLTHVLNTPSYMIGVRLG